MNIINRKGGNMPYKSQAQRKYFNYLESKGKMPKKTVDDFNQASQGMDLPSKKMAYGGFSRDDNTQTEFDQSQAPNPGYPDYKKRIDEDGADHFDDGGVAGQSLGDRIHYPKGASFMRSGGLVLDHGGEEDEQEWNNNTHGKYMAEGGEVEDEDEHTDGDGEMDLDDGDMDEYADEQSDMSEDEKTGDPWIFNSSGEPNTNRQLRSRHDMEYMARGGRVKRPKQQPGVDLDQMNAPNPMSQMAFGGLAGKSAQSDMGFAKALKKKRMFG
jgi:hypothetical protein